MFTSKQEEISRLAQALGVTNASIVADVGAGKGDYAIPLSQLAGKVFAVEANPDRLVTIHHKIKKQNIANVELINSSQSTCSLKAGSCDAAFLSNSYHHLTNPQSFNASLFAALKPGAKFAILDFSPKWYLTLFSPVRDVPKNRGGHGIPKDVVISELSTAGFVFKQDLGAWPRGRYGLLFTRG